MRELYEVDMKLHDAKLDAHTFNPFELLRIEAYISFGGGGVTQTLVADHLYAFPLFIIRNVTIDRLAIDVNTASAGDFARIGIYRNGVDLYPAELVVESAPLTVNAIAVMIDTPAAPIVLTKGLYWVAIISDGVPQIEGYGVEAGLNILGHNPADFAVHYGGWDLAVAYGALPDPYTAGAVLYAGNRSIIAPRILTLDPN
ncbi:hypothetical protein ES703_32935 [subsurface metagenome]